MKVLHIFDRSLPDSSGYSIRSKYIIEFQKSMGLEPIAITSPKYIETKENEEINGICYYRSHKPKDIISSLGLRVPFIREKVIMKTLYRDILKIIDKNKIDIIHAHSPSLCGLPAMKAAKKFTIPFVYETRALWEDAAVDLGRFKENSFKYKVSQYMENKLFKNADGAICICQGLKDEISKRTAKKVHVIKNGVDVKNFVAIDKKQELIDKYNLRDKIVIGFIGSFFTFEGLDCLIKSAAQVLAKNNNIQFMIVGAGVEDKNTRDLAKELKIFGKGVIFTGKVPHSEVLDYYSIMDILVYPRISKRITELVTPLKPLEAMSMEKAVIASNVGGLKELIKNNITGLLFNAGNIDDLTEKILDLVNDSRKRDILGRNARLDMIENRDWVKIVSKCTDIYKSILEGRQREKGKIAIPSCQL